jgi:hypothetical protein
LFPNQKIGVWAREKSTHLYIDNIQPNWTPIEPIIKDIRIGKNQFHSIIKIQLLIKLATTKKIHPSQGFSLDDLAFNPINVKKMDYHFILFFTFEQKNDYTCQLHSNIKTFTLINV